MKQGERRSKTENKKLRQIKHAQRPLKKRCVHSTNKSKCPKRREAIWRAGVQVEAVKSTVKRNRAENNTGSLLTVLTVLAQTFSSVLITTVA